MIIPVTLAVYLKQRALGQGSYEKKHSVRSAVLLAVHLYQHEYDLAKFILTETINCVLYNILNISKMIFQW